MGLLGWKRERKNIVTNIRKRILGRQKSEKTEKIIKLFYNINSSSRLKKKQYMLVPLIYIAIENQGYAKQ